MGDIHDTLSMNINPEDLLWLEIDNVEIETMSFITNFKNLRRLEVRGSNIKKIEGLEELNDLIHLDLASNEITKIEGLTTLQNLEHLVLSGNRITKIEKLDTLQQLRYIDISNNAIEKVDGLLPLKNLEYIDLSYNYIKNVEKLDKLVELNKINIIYNPRNIKTEMTERRTLELKRIYQLFSDAENVQYILILLKSGLPVYSKSFSEVPIDEGLLSGFLSAISSFGAEIGSQFTPSSESSGEGKDGLEQLSYGRFKIIVDDLGLVRTAILLLSDASSRVKFKLKQFNQSIMDKFGSQLENWTGKSLPGQEITTMVEDAFDMHLTYNYNAVQFRVDQFLEQATRPSLQQRILNIIKDDPFNGFFMIRRLLEALKLDGIDEIKAFDGIRKLEAEGMIFPLSPKMKQIVLNYEGITNQLPLDAKIIIKEYHDGVDVKGELQTMEEIDDFYKNVGMLKQLGLMTEDLQLTQKGEELGYYFKYFLEY